MRFAIADVSLIVSANTLYAHIEYLMDAAPSLVSMNVHNQIDSAPNIRLDGIQVQATAPAHH